MPNVSITNTMTESVTVTVSGIGNDQLLEKYLEFVFRRYPGVDPFKDILTR